MAQLSWGGGVYLPGGIQQLSLELLFFVSSIFSCVASKAGHFFRPH